jgi:hypothetical protein
VIARDDDHIPAAGGWNTAQEFIIEFLGTIARRAGIKDIACYDEQVYLVFM